MTIEYTEATFSFCYFTLLFIDMTDTTLLLELITKQLNVNKTHMAKYDRMILKTKDDSVRCQKYLNAAAESRDLQRCLERVQKFLVTPRKRLYQKNRRAILGLDQENDMKDRLPLGFLDDPYNLAPTDITGLPEEVIAELNISPSDKTDAIIIDLIKMAGGTLILDKIIAGLAHLTGEVHQRSALTARLYRMAKKGLIQSVKGKKGVYTIHRSSLQDFL